MVLHGVLLQCSSSQRTRKRVLEILCSIVSVLENTRLIISYYYYYAYYYNIILLLEQQHKHRRYSHPPLLLLASTTTIKQQQQQQTTHGVDEQSAIRYSQRHRLVLTAFRSNFTDHFDGIELIPQNFAATPPKTAISDEGNRG